MKEKILTMLLSSAMIATMLVGCGSEPTTTPQEEVIEEESTQEVEETTTQEIEEVVEEDVQEETQVEEPTQEEFGEFIVSHRFDGGYVDEYQNPDNEEMSDYDVYLDINGDEMFYTFTGPKGIGNLVAGDENDILISTENETHGVLAWYGGNDAIEEWETYTLLLPGEEWMSFTSDTHPENGYCEYNATDTKIEITFAVTGADKSGYAYFVVDKDLGVCYQFEYVELNENYDDARALEVVNSIQIGEENFHPIQ